MDDLISRQEALEKVRTMQTYKLFMGDDMILIDKAEVQKELMMLPPAQPEPTDEQVLDYCKKRCLHIVTADVFQSTHLTHKVSFGDKDHVWIDGKQYISLPRFQEAVKEAGPKEGEWVQIQRCARDAQPDLECPFCKHRIGWWDMGRYCAGCGAKLEGGAG